jgi:chemotaxis protein histidine kinase CheA
MHSLKGTAATLGAQALADHVAELEKLFKQGLAPGQALDHMPALMTLVQSTRRAAEQALLSFEKACEQPEPPAQARPPADAHQRAGAQTFLRFMCALMAKSDLDVLEQFARRGDALQALDPEAVKAIGQALQVLDFRTAMQLCVMQSKTLMDGSS